MGSRDEVRLTVRLPGWLATVGRSRLVGVMVAVGTATPFLFGALLSWVGGRGGSGFAFGQVWVYLLFMPWFLVVYLLAGRVLGALNKPD